MNKLMVVFVAAMLLSFSYPAQADVQAAAEKTGEESVSEERPSLEGYDGEAVFEEDVEEDELLDN